MGEVTAVNMPSANWAGNVTFSAARMHRPDTLGHLQQLVAHSDHVRALGTGHSFNHIADCRGDLVCLSGLPRIVEIDSGRGAVKVSAGMRYAELAEYLHAAGYALHNLASLPHISVAGTCATGTHGGGDHNRSLAAAVSALDLITADGDVLTLNRDADGDRFSGAVVALGALGIVTSITLDIEPAFEIQQFVYEDLPRERVNDQFDVIFSSGYSVSMFTDWSGSHIRQVWLKRKVQGWWRAEPGWLGARLADGPRHPVASMPPRQCTDQMGVPGPWHKRLPHFRAEFVPSTGAELQSEYLVPRACAVAALAAIDSIRDRVTPVLQICEIRTAAPDDLWLSPIYQRDTVAIHFTWVKDVQAVVPAMAAVEDQLAPFDARPHWGKMFGTSPRVIGELYERLPDFQRLLDYYDPVGKFSNEFIDRYVRRRGGR